MTEFEELLATDAAAPPPRVTRQKVLLLASCIALLLCLPIAVFSWAAAESSTSLLLIGDVSGIQIGIVAGMVGVVALLGLLWDASSSNGWLIVAIPGSVGAGLVLILALVLLPLTAVTSTLVQVDGCPTGYVAIERFGGVGNFVGVREGVRITKVHEYWADDFGRPFSRGTASVRAGSGAIDIAYPGGPGFSLPVLAPSTCTR